MAGTSLSVFLFLLFFQPFDIPNKDFNSQLLIFTGMGLIVFVAMLCVKIIYPRIFRKNRGQMKLSIPVNLINSTIILILISVAFAFFLHYVGDVSLSIYEVSKGAILGLMATLVLSFSESHIGLKRQIELLSQIHNEDREPIEKLNRENAERSVSLISANGAEIFQLDIADILLVKAADNYVEIIHRQHDELKHTLLRNTINNIEAQFSPFAPMIRCHRASIINVTYISTLRREGNNHVLILQEYPEPVPISRQYLLQVRKAMIPPGDE